MVVFVLLQKWSNTGVKAIEIVCPEGLDLDFLPNRTEPLEVSGPTPHTKQGQLEQVAQDLSSKIVISVNIQ